MSAAQDEITRIFKQIASDVFDEKMRERDKRRFESSPEDKSLKVSEVTQQLGVTEYVVYEMIKQRIINAYRPTPKTIRIMQSEINRYKQTGVPYHEWIKDNAV